MVEDMEKRKNMSEKESARNETQIKSVEPSQPQAHYDSAYSWAVCAAIFICNALTLGFSYSIGVYYVVFLDVFGHSSGITAWMSSLNFGSAMFIGKSVQPTTDNGSKWNLKELTCCQFLDIRQCT